MYKFSGQPDFFFLKNESGMRLFDVSPETQASQVHCAKLVSTCGVIPKTGPMFLRGQCEELFTLEELKRAGGRLEANKAPGIDGMPNEILKEVIVVYPEFFLGAFNFCLREVLRRLEKVEVVPAIRSILRDGRSASKRWFTTSDPLGKERLIHLTLSSLTLFNSQFTEEVTNIGDYIGIPSELAER